MADPCNLDPRFYDQRDLFIEAIARTAPLAHRSVLPRALTSSLISPAEQIAIAFVLSFLEEEHLGAPLLISGGYVRDLLLGVPPADLDLSICLAKCPRDVNIAVIIDGLPAFARRRPDLRVSEVSITTALSDTARGKEVDTAKVRMVVGGESLNVDFMPTIGTETYDAADRVPCRDGRGTPEQDALRRDLTIGSMLLEVSRGQMLPPWIYWPRRVKQLGAEGLGLSPSPPRDRARRTEARPLQYTLLDYYGGVADLRARVLRSPVPRGRQFDELWTEVTPRTPARSLSFVLNLTLPQQQPCPLPLPLTPDPTPEQVMASPADSQLAAQLGLGMRIASPGRGRGTGRRQSVWACGARLASASEAQHQRGMRVAAAASAASVGAASVAVAPPSAEVRRSRNQDALLQAVWWVKVLRDDPLRVLRAGRFTARLGFPLHDAFWFAAPFALAALESKVAGSRKFAELRKVAAEGPQPTLAFMHFAFGRAIGERRTRTPPPPTPTTRPPPPPPPRLTPRRHYPAPPPPPTALRRCPPADPPPPAASRASRARAPRAQAARAGPAP